MLKLVVTRQQPTHLDIRVAEPWSLTTVEVVLHADYSSYVFPPLFAYRKYSRYYRWQSHIRTDDTWPCYCNRLHTPAVMKAALEDLRDCHWSWATMVQQSNGGKDWHVQKRTSSPFHKTMFTFIPQQETLSCCWSQMLLNMSLWRFSLVSMEMFTFCS